MTTKTTGLFNTARRAIAAGALAALLAGAAAPAWTPPAAAQVESDMDGDGLFDDDEALAYGTDPFSADTDGDATPDGVEVALGTDPLTAAAPGERIDTDSDGIFDFDEANLHGTDPLDYDTDQDGRSDGVEVGLGSNPRSPETHDTDGDGVTDADEAYVFNTDPLAAPAPEPIGPSPIDTTAADADGDGLSDFDETNVWGTDPNDANSDNDFYNDGFEASQVDLNPLNPDVDGDGMLDGCDTDDTTPETDPDVGMVCQY